MPANDVETLHSEKEHGTLKPDFFLPPLKTNIYLTTQARVPLTGERKKEATVECVMLARHHFK